MNECWNFGYRTAFRRRCAAARARRLRNRELASALVAAAVSAALCLTFAALASDDAQTVRDVIAARATMVARDAELRSRWLP